MVVHKWRHSLRQEGVKEIFDNSTKALVCVTIGNVIKHCPKLRYIIYGRPNYKLKFQKINIYSKIIQFFFLVYFCCCAKFKAKYFPYKLFLKSRLKAIFIISKITFPPNRKKLVVGS